ncbi:MAG TPA: hypothetical protein VHE59_11335 [Mucilaginibacter sp.]|nr:hypothetical protein [Mucilaginibacter sp.]
MEKFKKLSREEMKKSVAHREEGVLMEKYVPGLAGSMAHGYQGLINVTLGVIVFQMLAMGLVKAENASRVELISNRYF